MLKKIDSPSSSPRSHSPTSPVSRSTFSRAERTPCDPILLAQMKTPPPWRYDANIKVVQAKAPNMKFPKGPRFPTNEFISKEHAKKGMLVTSGPSPCDYQKDIFSLTDPGHKHTITAARPSPKMFISRNHTSDAVGKDSPGPKYDTSVGIERSGPSYTFGLSDRTDIIKTDPTIPPPDHVCHVELDSHSGKPRRCCLSREKKDAESLLGGKPPLSKTTPGPAFYSPRYDVVKPAGKVVSIPKEQKGQIIRQDVRTPCGLDYHPQYGYVMPKAPKCTMGSDTPNPDLDRFESNTFKGKGVGEMPGKDSPGPGQYEQDSMYVFSPAYTIASKERTIRRTYVSGPSKARLLSSSLAKENLGVYSPGPKYLPSESWTRPGGPSFSFGTSDREFVEMSDEHKSRVQGTKTPGGVRFISPQHCKTVFGSETPGPASKLNPKLDCLSTVGAKKAHKIHAPTERKTPKNYVDEFASMSNRSFTQSPHHSNSPGGEGGGTPDDGSPDGDPLFRPVTSLDVVRSKAPQYSLSHSDRNTSLVKSSTPGAGSYKLNYNSVDKNIAAKGFGGLGGRVPKLPKGLKL